MDPTSVGGIIGAALAAGWGAFQTVAASKAKKDAQAAEQKAATAQVKAETNLEAAAVSNQLAEKAVTLEKLCDYWRDKFDALMIEMGARMDKMTAQHEKDRDGWHEKAGLAQVNLSKCQEENIILRARTDMKPLLEHIDTMQSGMREDADIRKATLGVLGKINGSLDRIHSRLDAIEQKGQHADV